jgi:hypothetical protein
MNIIRISLSNNKNLLNAPVYLSLAQRGYYWHLLQGGELKNRHSKSPVSPGTDTRLVLYSKIKFQSPLLNLRHRSAQTEPPLRWWTIDVLLAASSHRRFHCSCGREWHIILSLILPKPNPLPPWDYSYGVVVTRKKLSDNMKKDRCWLVFCILKLNLMVD